MMRGWKHRFDSDPMAGVVGALNSPDDEGMETLAGCTNPGRWYSALNSPDDEGMETRPLSR